ncbi:DUF6980 family protein [Clostridium perfringens]|nr:MULTISPECIES: hypothetical protein [Clostridium]MDK7589825.1 hypothetical protein [Clostridium sp. UMB9555B]MDK7627782.1 hypothetical protein [Clostridium sp. UMB9555A]
MRRGVRLMNCDFCKEPFGKEFKINKSPNDFEQPNEAFIYLMENDTPGIVLMKNKSSSGWFDIKYCPFCGEKLIGEENE